VHFVDGVKNKPEVAPLLLRHVRPIGREGLVVSCARARASPAEGPPPPFHTKAPSSRGGAKEICPTSYQLDMLGKFETGTTPSRQVRGQDAPAMLSRTAGSLGPGAAAFPWAAAVALIRKPTQTRSEREPILAKRASFAQP
jgi:hypothetical protein